MNITIDQLKEGIKKIPGCAIISVTYEAEPNMRKKNNPYLGIIKRSVINGQIGADYEKSVNRQLVKYYDNVTFEAGPHSWAEAVDRHFVYKDNNAYFRMQERSRSEQFFFNGNEIDKELLLPFLFIPKQEELVKYRNLDLKKIISMRWGGQEYKLIH